MRGRIDNVTRRYRRLQSNLLAFKEYNMTMGQLPSLIRERHLWIRITRNFREIEGSWSGALRRFLIMFQNHPRK